MKSILFLLILLNTACLAQSYDEAVVKCTAKFQDGLTPENAEANIELRMTELRECMIGLKFPLFNVRDIHGIEYTAEDLRGKVVLVNLWFIGCHPCVSEIPMFNELAKELDPNDFVILSFGRDDTNSVADFLINHPMNYSVFANSNKLIADTFRLTFGYPTNIFLNKEGEIVEFMTGGPIEAEGLKRSKEKMTKIINQHIK